MSKRDRIASFGGAGLFIVLGVLAAVVVGGGAGQVVGMVLVGTGLVAVVSLLFYEVGLSEDAERAREARRGSTARGPSTSGRGVPSREAGLERRRPRLARRRPRLARSRGQRRRLDRGR